MSMGLTFNNKHSFKDFGIWMYSKNRSILPEPKIVAEEVPGMDGEYDYSEVNPDKRTKYKTRNHEVEFSITERDPKRLRIKAHEIATWVACGEQRLIYDDETAVFYLARVINKLDLENQIFNVKRFTVEFKCRPFALSVIKSDQPLQIGQGLMTGYGYRLDMVPTVFQVTGPTSINVYNPGTYVKPIIKVQGSLNNISFSSNGQTLTFGSALNNQDLLIDCAKMQVVEDGSNAMNKMSGDFIDLTKGNNILSISGSGLNCTVSLIFNYIYL